jgi:nucleotide-binding universal stress UspA family protein
VASSSAPTRHGRDLPPPFGRIVCGVDGSRSAHVAVDQAITVSGPSTTLIFVCVREESGAGATRQATITAGRADEAVRAAVRAAREACIGAAGEVVTGDEPAHKVLLDEASGADLLVVASHVGSRAGGIALADTASAAVHRASVPVLVARRLPETPFPSRILVASDGSDEADRAVELAARIAKRHTADLYLLSAPTGTHGDPEQVSREAVELTADLGVEPTVIRTAGHPADDILEAAAAHQVSLVILGSRGLTGVRALGSVSERVANQAPCSVLVARPA